MKLKLYQNYSAVFRHSHTMKDGDLAMITKWCGSPSYVGRIVQRYRQDLITVGEDSVVKVGSVGLIAKRIQWVIIWLKFWIIRVLN